MSSTANMETPSAESAVHQNGGLMESTSTAADRPTTPSGIKHGPVISAGAEGMDAKPPVTPIKPMVKKEAIPTPRFRKRVPWRGKNILILLPKDDERGQPGKGPIPLREHEVANMFREWGQLGYDIRGFDLNEPTESTLPAEQHSLSREEWPDAEDILRERTERKFQVTLPDIEAWKKYVDELNEAKLRALGVSFGDEEPPPAPPASSISPNLPGLSRRATVTQYPPLPFSPPIPTSSASSQPPQQYPFPPQGGINGVGSPASFHRQTMSIAPAQSPFGFMPPQPQPSPRDMLLQQQGMHRVSPSLSTSPFSPGGVQPPMAHQRHQSLQFPQLPHQQLMPSARASPRLQELREEDEEEQTKNPSETPEAAPFVRHNASDSLQREIDEAEYHLEEQLRSQFEHDEDYSPHNAGEKAQPRPNPQLQFAPQAPRFEGGIDKDLVLHHPRPHSRGHSLSQKYFGEEDARDNSGAAKPSNLKTIHDSKVDDEIETNPSNLGTPVLDKFPNLSHDRTFSNPWRDVQSTSRRPSHERKPSSSSKFNVEAPEFKFNPTSTFQPGQFNFGSNTFQPAVFQGALEQKPQEVFQTNDLHPPPAPTSKINVNAPVFSPGSSEFSFSAAGAPTFRPDAPAFTPLQSFNGSVTSPVLSGSENGKPASIFGNIDLNMPGIVKPVKQSKAIPIIRPTSRSSDKEKPQPAVTEDENGRIIDESRIKRFRGVGADDDEEARFAQPTEQVELGPSADREAYDERRGPETGMSSTFVSDSTDAKDTTSLSDVSVADQITTTWAPVELRSSDEIADFNAARPFGDDIFQPRHKTSLSASAKAFVPVSADSIVDGDKEDTPVPDDFNGSIMETTEQAEVSPVDEDVTEDIPQESVESEPSPIDTEGEEGDGSCDQAIWATSPSPANKGLAGSRFAASLSPAKGLAASKHARSPSEASEVQAPDTEQNDMTSPAAQDLEDTQETMSQSSSPPLEEIRDNGEPTFEEIDAVMRHINEHDPSMGVKKTVDTPTWHQPSPAQPIPIPGAGNESPKHVHPRLRDFRAPSPSPRHYHLPLGVHQTLHSNDMEDPFLDPPVSTQLSRLDTSDSQVPSQAASDDWERAFSDEEQEKLDTRVTFFDGRVNDLVGGVLEARLGPLEKTLEGIHKALSTLSGRPQSNRHERRSVSAEVQESDADDEDDEPVARRSMSPQRNKRMEQIRLAVLDAFAVQQRNASAQPPLPLAFKSAEESHEGMASIMKAMEDMKQQFSESLHLDFRAEDLRNVVEEAVDRRMPAGSQPAAGFQEDIAEKFNDLQSRYSDLEQRLRLEEARSSTEIASRRIADDRAAELERQLQMAETRLEMEISTRGIYDHRIAELEDKLKHQEELNEAETNLRRAAEDRLAEIQRLLRISSEEEIRLRETLEEKDERISVLDANNNKNVMRLDLLEAHLENALKEKSELESRVSIAEVDAGDLRQETNRWRIEAERAIQLSERQGDDLHSALEEKRQLHVLIDSLGTQLNENERIRDELRSKFLSLQDDMGRAAHEIAEENARRAKHEQTMLARQEVLDAKLQAESRTRERLETELERLEAGERQGMKAVNEAKRLEVLLGDMRTENHKLQQTAMRYQAEFQEARESGAREIQRTRESMQSQIEDANHQVNVVRQQLEDDISRLQAELDQSKMDADTLRSRYDMLVEDARHNSKGDVDEMVRKHQDDVEDMQARFERQLNNTMEDAQRAESNLLERLSLSTSRCEHLQDRVTHLEEKLEIAREAARAAAQAAKASGVTPPPTAAAPMLPPGSQPVAPAQSQPQSRAMAQAMQLPEKISPQALRESIMVLQEQLQEREQKIEGLEQRLSKLDPAADIKIAKRDDEITWLRELLAVRHSDLHDIITALGRDDYDQNRVRDAAIRLKANLQMEQQERERAMNGGSSINLPNIAASLRDAAPARVAQAVGPLAAALGNWRKSGSFANAMAPPEVSSNNATPRKDSPASQSSFLSGLLTPPASGVRQTPSPDQPTAFTSTGRRFTPQDLANRPKPPPSQRQAQKMPARAESPLRRPNLPNGPQTPPMMRSTSYDDDAMAEDFDDFGFFDEE